MFYKSGLNNWNIFEVFCNVIRGMHSVVGNPLRYSNYSIPFPSEKACLSLVFFFAMPIFTVNFYGNPPFGEHEIYAISTYGVFLLVMYAQSIEGNARVALYGCFPFVFPITGERAELAVPGGGVAKPFSTFLAGCGVWRASAFLAAIIPGVVIGINEHRVTPSTGDVIGICSSTFKAANSIPISRRCRYCEFLVAFWANFRDAARLSFFGAIGGTVDTFPSVKRGPVHIEFFTTILAKHILSGLSPLVVAGRRAKIMFTSLFLSPYKVYPAMVASVLVWHESTLNINAPGNLSAIGV